ncbi:MAG TPA: hypothetical protein VFE47_30915 [Tepidisphaeraceae bacterium]|nr:hypothetical protein [Tepidisphaeraceae bacterium]
MPRWYLVVGLGLLVLVGRGATLGAADASVDDAKRKLAAQMFAESHLKDAEAILKEVIAHDDTQYRDHLMLGQIYDKLQMPEQAADQYRRVLTLLPDRPTDRDGFKARSQADARLKVLDAMSAKINEAIEEFGKKLDSLSREAMQQRNLPSIQKIAIVRAALWKAQKPETRVTVDIAAGKQWQAAGFAVVAGHKYHIAAIGAWKPTPGVSCGADGISGQTNVNGNIGSVMCDLAGSVIPVGVQTEFTAKASGELLFACNLDPDIKVGRATASGNVIVLIEPL